MVDVKTITNAGKRTEEMFAGSAVRNAGKATAARAAAMNVGPRVGLIEGTLGKSMGIGSRFMTYVMYLSGAAWLSDKVGLTSFSNLLRKPNTVTLGDVATGGSTVLNAAAGAANKAKLNGVGTRLSDAATKVQGIEGRAANKVSEVAGRGLNYAAGKVEKSGLFDFLTTRASAKAAKAAEAASTVVGKHNDMLTGLASRVGAHGVADFADIGTTLHSATVAKDHKGVADAAARLFSRASVAEVGPNLNEETRNVAAEALKELNKTVGKELGKAAKAVGKAEALKDLPNGMRSGAVMNHFKRMTLAQGVQTGLMVGSSAMGTMHFAKNAASMSRAAKEMEAAFGKNSEEVKAVRRSMRWQNIAGGASQLASWGTTIASALGKGGMKVFGLNIVFSAGGGMLASALGGDNAVLQSWAGLSDALKHGHATPQHYGAFLSLLSFADASGKEVKPSDEQMMALAEHYHGAPPATLALEAKAGILAEKVKTLQADEALPPMQTERGTHTQQILAQRGLSTRTKVLAGTGALAAAGAALYASKHPEAHKQLVEGVTSNFAKAGDFVKRTVRRVPAGTDIGLGA